MQTASVNRYPDWRKNADEANRRIEGKGWKSIRVNGGSGRYYSFERSMNKPFDSIVDIGVTLYVTETDVTTCQPED